MLRVPVRDWVCVALACVRSVYQNNVAVLRRFLLFLFARNDVSKIPQVLFGALRVEDRFLSGSRGSPSCRSWRASLILSVFALTVLTTACANALPEVASWQFTAVSFDRTDPPPAPYGEKPSSGWRTIVSGSCCHQTKRERGWVEDRGNTLRNRMAVISARD